jgi:hypothetical protein
MDVQPPSASVGYFFVVITSFRADYAARIHFCNWLLQNVHDGIVDPQLLFMTDDRGPTS